MRLRLGGLEVLSLGIELHLLQARLCIVGVLRLPRSELVLCKGESPGVDILWLLWTKLHVFNVWHTDLAEICHGGLVPTS